MITEAKGSPTAVSLTKTDQTNVAENKETTIDRTLRLLYVTCSRARESLALVLWSSNLESAVRNIKAGDWFSELEIKTVPEA
jgi:DNA helicase-2/ATP-dependent DNA helicase PcrA